LPNIVIYTIQEGKSKLEGEMIWLNQKRIAKLYGKSESTASGHISNILIRKSKMKIQFDPSLEYRQNTIKSVNLERGEFPKMFPIMNAVHSQLNWSQGGNCGKN